MTRTHEITELLQAWSRGDPEALAKLLPLVDHELRLIAHAYLDKERTGHPIHTSTLVQEALARLIVGEPINWKSRKQFYAIIARRMRHILIEYARGQLTAKRGKRARQVDFDEAILMPAEMPNELILLDEALTKLARIEERKAMVVELRYFGGCTLEEIASILGVAQITVERDWRFARSWLFREITGEEE